MLNIGNTVRLKSGGTLMTVEGFDEKKRDFVVCVWHEKERPFRESYHQDTLELDDGSLPSPFTI
ncbi:DUF2158 domain-containing protein [Methylomonas sp. EFPC1]|uniref:YodC family protein n=1 Tax=Methylomonas sp. EFPC1 TaxID=2812647 RepID=UPI00196747B2|nr:DUF2158 domain-containing protein [Methylomonas sp. EFPC1]QSB00287.1 DUF2158 domain-containing protein [Methylomonas sp. EFPC1]